MDEVKRILAAVGQSPYSEGNYRFAARMALALEADLIVVSVINEKDVDAVRSISDMGYNVDQEHYVAELRTQREDFLKGLVSAFPFPEDRLFIRVRLGNPTERLLRTIIEEKADMVIMGPKGRTNLEQMLVGSVAARLFRRSPATVVTYRDPATRKKLEKRVHID